MKIAVVGSGNVAWHFCQRFYQAGISIEFVLGRTNPTVNSLAKEVGTRGITRFDQIKRNVDIYILAIHDDAIGEVSGQIRDIAEKSIIVHTSGTVSKDIFSGLFDTYGIMYPYQSVTKGISLPYDQLPIIIDGNSENAIEILKKIGSKISPNVHYFPEKKRQILHLAGVFTNNFTNAILSVAYKICRQEDISFELAFPLLQETIRKVQVSDPESAQTGPALRGDVNTILNHLEKLEHQPQWASLYEEITKLINPDITFDKP